MGYGDAKLLSMVGALLGWRAVAAVLPGAAMVGLVITIPRLILRGSKLRGTEVPFGPFIVIAALLYLFFGHHLPWPFTFVAS
jgi:leader peptidase (prepilin peptidase)/N-methyltransferase